MNTRWLKQNQLLLMFVVLFVVVFGFVGSKLWGKYDAYQNIQAALAEKQSQLDQLLNNDPTPTDANKLATEENFKLLQEQQHQLHQLVTQNAAASSKSFKNNIQFADYLRHTVEAMEANAYKAKIIVPKDFKFGFKRYATNLPKNNPRTLERLGKQVAVVEKFITMMIESGVEELDSIRRVEIEPGPLGEDSLPDSVSIHPQEHYSAMPFELQFACNAKPLQTLINKIAAADTFFVIRLVTIEQEAVQKNPDQPAPTAMTMSVAVSTEKPFSCA